MRHYVSEKRKLIEDFINGYFNPSVNPSILHDSVIYSLTAGGKRLRPILCIAAYEACGGRENIVPYATALEFIHTYSLIHDDLPAMDNDDLRRGKPTNHKVFGEAIAILAGDGLLTEAFTILSNTNYAKINPKTLLNIIAEISKAAGLRGMVAGQALDLISEGKEPDRETVEFIHLHKTAALIRASVKAGALLAETTEERVYKLEKYGESIGLAFQIVDDILDIEGTTEEMGKPKGSDIERGKMTYPSVFGIEESRRKAKELVDIAIELLRDFGEEAEPLRKIARYIIKRSS
ncbi:polyprenyl synthetase family protein [Thermodesulfovibrio sp.]|uniref:polyprenyl synthetase family protein n=1 Tax=Thermodesulfovibrio sp. TaxID=2067987 RepID=UPI0030962A28